MTPQFFASLLGSLFSFAMSAVALWRPGLQIPAADGTLAATVFSGLGTALAGFYVHSSHQHKQEIARIAAATGAVITEAENIIKKPGNLP